MERNIYFLVVERTTEGKSLAKVATVPEGMNLARHLTDEQTVIAPFLTVEKATQVAVTLNERYRQDGTLSEPNLTENTAPALHWF